jgi:WD40 repeat protein
MEMSRTKKLLGLRLFRAIGRLSLSVSIVVATMVIAGGVGGRALAMGRFKKGAAEIPKIRVDLYGDALPRGAVARLGTHRLRHLNNVASVAYSPDGKTLASGGADRAVVIWDSATGKPLHRLLGHTNNVYTLAYSRDGKLLASGSRINGQVILWDPVAGKLIRELGTTSSAHWVAFSPDGKMLATVSAGGIHLWQVSTGQRMREIIEQRAFWAQFSPDNKTLIYASGRGKETSSIRFWDSARGKEIRSLQWNNVYSLALSADGRMLAAGSKDGAVRVWDAASGQILVESPPVGTESRWNASLAFSPDGKFLASAGDTSRSRMVRILDVKTGKELRSWDGPPAGISSVAFSPDGRRLVSAGRRAQMAVWDPATGKKVLQPDSHWASVRSVAFLSEGRQVISKSLDGTARLWDVPIGKQRNQIPTNWQTGISRDGRLLAVRASGGAIKLRDLETGKILYVLTGHQHLVKLFAFSPDGLTLASLDRAGQLRAWDVVSGEQIAVFAEPIGLGVLLFSPDGKSLVTAGQRPGADAYPIQLWNVATAEKTGEFGLGDDPVASLAFSDDGKLLASGHGRISKTRAIPASSSAPSVSSNSVRLWQVDSGQEVGSLKGHTAAVASVAFSGDGNIVASGGMDGTVRLWQVTTGKEIAKVEGHGLPALKGTGYSEVYAVTFSPDGKLVASGSADGTVLLWDVATLVESGAKD